MSTAIHHPAGSGPHYLMLGTDVTSRLFGGDDTEDELALIEATAPPGGGPGLHIDPWRESFYILQGELTFEIHDDTGRHRFPAGVGDAVSIPQGAGHGFKITGTEPARWLVISSPAGLERFFAAAGEQLPTAAPPSEPGTPDRDRLLAAFAAHGLQPFEPGPPTEARAGHGAEPHQAGATAVGR